jgi:hypothetical protein
MSSLAFGAQPVWFFWRLRTTFFRKCSSINLNVVALKWLLLSIVYKSAGLDKVKGIGEVLKDKHL